MAQVETASQSRKLQVKEAGPCRLEVTVEVPPEDVKTHLGERFVELNGSVTLPGFRRGHAPRRLLEKRFGEEVGSEIKLHLLRESLRQLHEEHQVTPLADPDIDLSKVALSESAPCRFTYTVEVKPKVTFEDYKGLPARKPQATVEDRETQHALDHLRESKAELVVAPDGRVAEGDQVIGDLETTLDGAAHQKQENAAFFVNSALTVFGQPAPELARAILGRRAGDTVAVPVALPVEHRDPALAGKTLQLSVRVTEVKRRELPPMTDAWATDMGFDDLAALKARVRERIQQEKEAEARRQVEEELLAEIRKRAGMALPAGVVQRESQRMLQRAALDLYTQGVPEAEIDKRVQELQAASSDAVTVALQNHFLIEHIATREKIYVTEGEVEDHITQIASRYGRWPHEVKKWLESNDQLGELRRKMREEKVRAFLLEHATMS